MKESNNTIKAVILAAGMGSRIRPLTDDCPKSLLQINGQPILDRMISNIQDCGIKDVAIVVGYLQEKIIDYVTKQFPNLRVQYIVNKRYAETNTAYSLMLTKDWVKDSTMVKFDADVIFDKAILTQLIESEFENCLCIDKNIHLDAEEIKVITDDKNRVMFASKTVLPKDAIGESIGIEKISGTTAQLLFSELGIMMSNEQDHQKYYEAAYERLIENFVPFHALDITGLNWVEIDTLEDFNMAESIFGFQ